MNDKGRTLVIILVVVIDGLLGYHFLTMPDNRSTGDRIGDAIDALPEGPGAAADQLGDRTPGERLGDAVKDVGNDIERSTDGR